MEQSVRTLRRVRVAGHCQSQLLPGWHVFSASERLIHVFAFTRQTGQNSYELGVYVFDCFLLLLTRLIFNKHS